MSSEPPSEFWKAVSAARMAVLLAPDSLESRKSLATILLQAGDAAGALMHYEIAARDARPGDFDLAVGLTRALAMVGLHEDAASTCRRTEQAGSATAADRERLRAALAPRPAPSSETLTHARRLLEEGERNAARGHVTQALEAYRICAQLLPDMADVALDTLHFNGMNTSIDALSVGTPVVTLPTGLQRGRFTQAMYRTMGIDWGVARDVDEYAALAAEAAMDAERQHGLRQLILERSHLLFEDTHVVEEFERFFLTAHRRAMGGSA